MSKATAPAAADRAAATASLARTLQQGIAAATDAPQRAPATALPHGPAEIRPSDQQLRAERPLGPLPGIDETAPGSARAAPSPPAAKPAPPPPAGLPAGGVPSALVEPQPNLPDADRPDADRPDADRSDAGRSDAGETAVAAAPGATVGLRNRRLYRRVALAAKFEVAGAPAELIDVSMGGFAIAGAPTAEVGAVVPVAVYLSIDGVDISTRMRARILYTAALRSGGRFIDLTPSQTALLRYIVTWRGQSLGALGTTTLLDAIARTPARSQPADPSLPEFGRPQFGRPQPSPRPRWWSRWFGRLLPSRR